MSTATPDAPSQPAAPPQAPVAYQHAPPSKFERLMMRLWAKPAWLAPTAIALCVASALGYVLANNPTDSQRDPLSGCAFQAVTGYNCPGCGGTRMVWYLLHGNLISAAQHHLVALIAVPVLVYAYISWVGARISPRVKKWLPMVKISGWMLAAYGGVWLLYSVLRNIPVEPFSWFYV